MPGKTKKDIYIGKSLEELNKKVDGSDSKASPRVIANSATKIIQAADKAYSAQDEERAYILYMRYALLWRVVRGSNEYTKDPKFYDALLGKKEIKRAVNLAEELSASLEARYKYNEEEKEVKAKLSLQAEKGEESSNGAIEEEITENGEAALPEEDKIGSSGWLKAVELHNILASKELSILVMDVRSLEQYQSSQMKNITSINVPRDIIKAGSTASTLQKSLPPESQTHWRNRGDFDYILLVDWDCSENDLKQGSTLASLKDALFKWDNTVPLKHEPLILQGGYSDWILRYPMYSSNPRVTKPPSYDSLMKPKGSLDFDYPDFDEKPPEPPKPHNQEVNIHPSQTLPPGQGPSQSIPAVNRTLKPQISTPAPSLTNGSATPAVASALMKNKSSGTTNGVGSTFQSNGASVKTKQPVGEIKVAEEKPKLPVVDRTSKPQNVDNKGGSHGVNGEKEKTKTEDQVEKQEQEGQESEMAKEKMEMAKLRKQEEAVREQLERMRAEKTKLINKELKKENEELEASIKDKMAEIKRLEVEMEAHKARLKKKLVEENGGVQGVTRGQEIKSKDGTTQVKPSSSDRDEVKGTKADVSSPAVEPVSKATVNADVGKQTPQSPILPAGWEMKWDESKNRYYYIDHKTKTSHWELPAVAKAQPKMADSGKTSATVSGKEQVKPDSLRLAKPHASSSPEKKSQGTTKVPLKTDATPSPGGSTLKRSFSSPNIAKMVADEEQFRKTPTVDRTKKPANRPTPAQYYQQQQAVARKRHLDPVYGSQARGLTGLRNLGNTCFMNSVVQCLSNTTLLTRYFLHDTYLADINDKNPMGHKGDMAIEFAVVVKALWAGQYKSIAPRDLLRMVTKQSVEFSMNRGHHHDSQECLIYLMDGLHEDLNQVKERKYVKEEDFSKLPVSEGAARSWANHLGQNKSIIVSLFQGQFRSVVRCLVCNNKSVKYDSFMHLGLPIPSKTKCTLQDCLKEFSSEEKLVGDNAIHCSHCKRNRDSVKTIHICRLPHVLIIILKRFFQDGIWRQKLNTNVEYPLTALDMRNFSVRASESGGIYDLYAVSNHSGTLDGGHYTAYCKSAVNRKWYKYDDTEVFSAGAGSIRSEKAYILFYTSQDLPNP